MYPSRVLYECMFCLYYTASTNVRRVLFVQAQFALAPQHTVKTLTLICQAVACGVLTAHRPHTSPISTAHHKHRTASAA